MLEITKPKVRTQGKGTETCCHAFPPHPSCPLVLSSLFLQQEGNAARLFSFLSLPHSTLSRSGHMHDNVVKNERQHPVQLKETSEQHLMYLCVWPSNLEQLLILFNVIHLHDISSFLIVSDQQEKRDFADKGKKAEAVVM